MSGRAWFGYDDHNDTHEDGYVTIQNVDEHTGRSQRSADLVFTTTHGATATLTVQQQAADAFITIDNIVDDNGDAVLTLSSNAFVKYWIVGTSNCPLLDVVDQAITAGTTLNDINATPHSTGFTLVERDGEGTSHDGVALGSNIVNDYGAHFSYEFRIPFLTNRNTGAARTITMSVYNTSLSLVRTVTITQNAGTVVAEEEEVE